MKNQEGELIVKEKPRIKISIDLLKEIFLLKSADNVTSYLLIFFLSIYLYFET